MGDDKGKFIFLTWDKSGRQKNEDSLKTFIKAKSKEEPVIKLGKKDDRALLIFKSEKSVQFLKEQLRDPSFWTLTHIAAVKETNRVKITNLPTEADARQIVLFLTNKNNINKIQFNDKDVVVDQRYFRPLQGYCVVQLPSASDVHKMCDQNKKFQSFRNNKLSFEPYYEEIDPVEDDETCLRVDSVMIGVDELKLKYLREFCGEKDLQDKLVKLCGKVAWMKDGVSKIKVEFICSHAGEKVQHSKGWKEKVQALVEEVFKGIVVILKPLSNQVWEEVQEAIKRFSSDKVWVNEDSELFQLTLIGLENSEDLIKLEKAIDVIEPPKPKETIEIKDLDRTKVAAFHTLKLKNSIGDVEVEVDYKTGVIKVTGYKENVKNAEKQILILIAKIVVECLQLPSTEHAAILSTPLFRDEIEVQQDQLGERCGYTIDGTKLTVFSAEGSSLDELKNIILGLIKNETIEIQGRVENVNDIEREVKEVEKSFRPYVHVKLEKSSQPLTIQIICGAKYFPKAKADVERSLEKVMERQENIKLSEHMCAILSRRYTKKIEEDIRKAGLPKEALSISESKIQVSGTKEVRSKVKHIVQDAAKKIKLYWKEIEAEGIHDYFDSTEGYNFLKTVKDTAKSDFKFVTQKAMKEEDIFCIVILETGQAIFVGKGSLTDLKFPTDVVVNAANTQLDHKGGLANQIVKKGGVCIQEECSEHIKQNGELSVGDLFNSSPGKLQCQRIYHACGPEWKGGSTGEDGYLQTVIGNILSTMNKEPNYILQTLAMPLISAGIFGFPKPRAAKIVLTTLKNKYKDVPNVREVFFYDYNPETVRTIQKQMQAVFGDRCFHLPAKNLALGQGTMGKGEKPGKDFVQIRSGSRTLRLPGRRKLNFLWGELAKSAVEVLVNATPSAPKPSGKVSDALHQEAGVGFNMAGECEKEFRRAYQNNPVPDGNMVTTGTGRIPGAKKIFHLKIPQRWDSSNCRKILSESIKKCLQEASRLGMKSIAFPSIGTADCNYPPSEVATVFIRTVSEFVTGQNPESCSIKQIAIVVYKTDAVVTKEFEETIAKLYNMRPHRLEADIEDTVKEEDEEGKEEKGKNKEEREKRGSETPKMPEVSILSIYKKDGQMSAFEGSFSVSASTSAIVELQLGCIENSQADVIVCTTSSFPRLNGAIANATKKVGGPTLEQECKTTYQTYPSHGVASSGPGRLNCKRVYYAVLEDYKNNNEKNIYHNVFRCLETAEKNKMTSIALPTFGTGGFKYPDKVSASKMYDAISEFFKTKRHHLSEIIVVMYGPAQQTCQVFNQEAQNRFTQMIIPKSDKGSADIGAKQPYGGLKQLLWNLPNTAASVEITKGQLELSKADVILNTTSSYPHLNGLIPKAICKAAGPKLEQECLQFSGNVTKGMVEETNGYNLSCTKVYHFVMPDWKDDTGEKTIMDCVDDCLHKMKLSRLTSIAVPTIGTGGMRYNPALVARGIYRAAADFGNANKDCKIHINIVVFPKTEDVYKIFVDELQPFIRGSGSGEKPTKGVPSPGVDFVDNNIAIPTRKRDFVLFQFISDDYEDVKRVFGKIEEKVKKDRKTLPVELKKDNHVDDFQLVNTEKNKKFLESLEETYRVKVTFDQTKRKIVVNGLGDSAIKCYERLLRFIHDLREHSGLEKIGGFVYGSVEWYYTEDSGNIWVPYPRSLTYKLEDASAQQAQDVEFKDSDDQTYVVDFNTMEEFVKEKKDRKTLVKVMRKELTQGSKQNMPPNWKPMQNENLEEFVLKSNEQEFKDVEANFRRTLGRYNLSQIREIQRIQNKTLYQQYMTKKEEMEKKLNKIPNTERILWHGAKEDSVKQITANGFNRSYAGDTFNQVWYGRGVYFAVNSEYSTNDAYSVPDNSGWKRVFQAKVLTGQTAEVQRGYDKRYAPNLPGSQLDRYDSTCDSQANPQEFVIYHDVQAYPEYLIIFK